MTKCVACKSVNVERDKNDCGHFKPEKGRPIRMYHWRCKDCGYVATYAKTEGST